MNTLKDTTKGETYRLHICYACDPDEYPDSKPIDLPDKFAEHNEKVVIVRLRISQA